jgi:tetratricopeptide (TPR) repeat protein
MTQPIASLPLFTTRMRRGSGALVSFTLLLACVAAGFAVADPLADLDDMQTRAQYAFYTADERTLTAIVESIESMEVPSPLASTRLYAAAYARWKLAQLYAGEAGGAAVRTRRNEAIKAAQACQAHVAAALSLDSKMSESYVLDTACAMILNEQRVNGNGKAQPTCARSKSLRSALDRAPQNPRALLIEALCLSRTQTTSSTAAFDRLRDVVAAFEAAPASRPGVPDWGHAEALVLLGESYLQRGESHAARDAIEKALVLAPDYRHARELLDKADTRPP